MGQKGDGQRNVSDRPRPQGKRSMPVPPSHPNPSRTTSYPSTIATTSQLSSGTSTSLSPLTPTDQDRSPIDFNPRSHSILSPTTQTSFGVLRHTGPGAGPSRDEPVRANSKGHRQTSSVSDRMKQFENGTIGSHASQASRWVTQGTGKDEARDMLKREIIPLNSASSNRSGLSRPPNTRPYSLPAVAPLRLPSREPPPPSTDYRSKEREVPRDYSRLPVPAAASPTVSSGKMSSDGGSEKVRRLSGLFERKVSRLLRESRSPQATYTNHHMPERRKRQQRHSCATRLAESAFETRNRLHVSQLSRRQYCQSVGLRTPPQSLPTGAERNHRPAARQSVPCCRILRRCDQDYQPLASPPTPSTPFLM